MFNLYGNERLTEWKKFRDYLEESPNPLQDLAMFWSRAPFVNPYIDSDDQSTWPDPWHLILDDRFDNLAIALGMLYTLKLTRRFMNIECEIHKFVFPDEKSERFLLLVDQKDVLNYQYKEVVQLVDICEVKTSLLWSK